MLNMPPLVTEAGDLRVHGREGIYLPFVFQQDDGSPRDMTGADVRFELEGFTKALVAGDEADQMVLVIDQGELPDTIGRVVPFIVLDYSGATPHPVWEGNLIQTGWR